MLESRTQLNVFDACTVTRQWYRNEVLELRVEFLRTAAGPDLIL